MTTEYMGRDVGKPIGEPFTLPKKVEDKKLRKPRIARPNEPKGYRAKYDKGKFAGYEARITIDKVQVRIGLYKTEEEADKAYKDEREVQRKRLLAT